MESISSSLVTQQLLTVSSNHSQLRGLAIGQQLTGTVLTVAQHGTVALQVNQSTFNARTTLPLIAGQTLTLVVEKIGPEIRLKILDQQLHSSGLIQAIRQQLPRQGSAIELLMNLQRIARQTGGTRLPGSITQLARNITQSLTEVGGSLSGETVRQALLNSGHFLEQRLLKLLSEFRGGALQRDFKAGLIRLRTALADIIGQTKAQPARNEATSSVPLRPRGPAQAQINPAPVPARDAASIKALIDLSQQVDSALARIQLHQLTSLLEHEGARSVWILELPVRDGETVQLVRFRIEKEPSRDESQAAASFSILFSVRLQALGAVQARLTLWGDSISVVLHAERHRTVKLAQAHLDDLCVRLLQTGLTPESVVCLHGLHAEETPNIHTPLVDIQA